MEVLMVNLILFALSSYGAWFVFTTSELPLWWRLREIMATRSVTFAKFILCPLCSGFWVSLAMSYVFPLTGSAVRWPDEDFALWVVGPIVQALAGAATIFLIDTHVTRLEER